MLKRFVKTTVLAFAGVAAAFAVMEAWFRMTSATPLWHVLPVPEVSLYAPDGATGYAHRPGASGVWMTENRTRIAIPASGIRDRDRSGEPATDKRALVLGNSIFEALQVSAEETSSAVAERRLRAKGQDISVLNLGLSGATPAVDVARLLTRGSALKPDIAIVVLPFNELMAPQTRDDSAFPGYRRASSGDYQLAYGFRRGRGFQLRTSAAGEVMYAAMDKSLVATLLNNRKNIGLFAEFPSGRRAASPPPDDECASAKLDPHEALWLRSEPSEAAGVRDAVVNDLVQFRKNSGSRVVIASTGITARCVTRQSEREQLLNTIKARIAGAGLDFFDLDGRIAAKVGPENVPNLHGFGLSLGGGHLNERGNAVYGEILADVIEETLLQETGQPSPQAEP